jgi:transcriptional regulator with XRE-family HTH domain
MLRRPPSAGLPFREELAVSLRARPRDDRPSIALIGRSSASVAARAGRNNAAARRLRAKQVERLAVPRRLNQRPLHEAVSALQAERGGMKLRALADAAGISVSHLSKLLRGVEGKHAQPELLERLARALEVEPEHFIEYREAVAVEYLRADPRARDELYRRAKAAQKPRRR